MKVATLFRYPVKSMMGEELNSCEILEKGLLGDRAYGVIDEETGKLANAKNPKKWPDMFRYLASFTEPLKLDNLVPPVRITMPNGESIVSNQQDLNDRLTESFQRSVSLSSPSPATTKFEGYAPEGIKELENSGTVFSRNSSINTFFDTGIVHIITTASIDALRQLAPTSRIESRRFRPNIIVDVLEEEGFVEQDWIDRVILIGDKVKLKVVRSTKRCIMTTLSQGDLPNDPNVLRTLAQKNSANFGIYAEVLQTGRIQIGDKVVII